MSETFDIVIAGAGMAGASLASALASRGGAGLRVLAIEEEERPGYHATGRSAAFWTESYGGPGVQPLTTASGPVLGDLGMLAPRTALTIARAGEEERLADFAATFGSAGVEVEMLGRAELERRGPGLREDWVLGACEPSCCDIDVARLHQHYLADARAAGAVFRTRAGLRSAHTDGAGWSLSLADGSAISCGVLVDAAGAWADTVAGMAGLPPLRIQPYRRTVAQLAVDPPVPPALPLVLDLAGKFYFKPEAGKLWLSPHDETPSPPCDAAPEEIDVALAIDRLGGVVDWRVERVEHRWAGLRSFAPDRLPVYGPDPLEPRFFWFAGQGGFGIQTAPAAADLAARLLLGERAGIVDPASYAPSRLRLL